MQYLFKDVEVHPILDSLWVGKIEDEVYFSDKYDGYISNSRIGLLNPLKGGSPEKFFKKQPPLNTPSLTLGSYVHQLYLQPELFEMCEEFERPSGKLGLIADALYYKAIHTEDHINNSEFKDYVFNIADKLDYYKFSLGDKRIDNIINSSIEYWNNRKAYEDVHKTDKEILYGDKALFDKVHTCLNALENDKDIFNRMHPKGLLQDPIFRNEEAITIDFEVVNTKTNEKALFKWKSKIDNFVIDIETNEIFINDLKTIGRPTSNFIDNFNNYSYYRELFIYSYLLSMIAKRDYNMDQPNIYANCLVVSPVSENDSFVYNMNVNEFRAGRDEFRGLLGLALHYITKGYIVE